MTNAAALGSRLRGNDGMLFPAARLAPALVAERRWRWERTIRKRFPREWFVTAKSEVRTDFQSVARIAKARTASPFYEFAAPAIQLSQTTSGLGHLVCVVAGVARLRVRLAFD